MARAYRNFSGVLANVYQSGIMVASTPLGILEPEEAILTDRPDLGDGKNFYELGQTQARREKSSDTKFHADESCKVAEFVL